MHGGEKRGKSVRARRNADQNEAETGGGQKLELIKFNNMGILHKGAKGKKEKKKDKQTSIRRQSLPGNIGRICTVPKEALPIPGLSWGRRGSYRQGMLDHIKKKA